jgi:hypothetical protein
VKLIAVVALMIGMAPSMHAQDCRDALALVDSVKQSTARYQDSSIAERDGYRRIGMDFPAMGEHWINLRIATLDTFDVRHPSILLYARKNGELHLAGAAFTAFLDAGEAVPGPRFLARSWHNHAGTLDDELFAGEHQDFSGNDVFKVLVLHVWTFVPHASNPFAVENWRLPLLRAGFSLVDTARARTAALHTSSDYFARALTRIGVPREDEQTVRDLALGATDWEGFLRTVVERWPDVGRNVHRLTRVMHASSLCAAS